MRALVGLHAVPWLLRLLRDGGGDADIIDQAESHRLVVLAVVARRAHDRHAVTRPAGDDLLRQLERLPQVGLSFPTKAYAALRARLPVSDTNAPWRADVVQRLADRLVTEEPVCVAATVADKARAARS